jgi:limonene-1,2-epoxide hydrolase
MLKTPLEIAEEFLGLLEDAFSMLTEDVFYHSVPFPVIIGRDGVRQFHIDFGFGKDWRAEFNIINIAVVGNVVLSERLDVFYHTSGGTISLPVMGALTIENGMITIWRDYFYPTDFEKQLSEIKR